MANIVDKIKTRISYARWEKNTLPTLREIKPALLKYVNNKYNGNILVQQPAMFEMSQDKIIEWVEMFANDTITNLDLRQRFLDNLYNRNPNMILQLKTDAPRPNMSKEQEVEWQNSSTGRITTEDVNGNDIKPEDIGKVLCQVRLGVDKGNGKIETDFHNISMLVHEFAHSTAERNIAKEPMETKDDSGLEIEGIFMENLFMNYLSRNAAEVASFFDKEGVLEYSDLQNIINIVHSYHKEHDKGLSDRIRMIENEPYDSNNPTRKQYQYRYVVGDIYCGALNEEYRDNPSKTIDRYAMFLENNSSMSLDESSKILFGKNVSKDDVFKNFASILQYKSKESVMEY